MKKDKCMYCGKEVDYSGYLICDDCWEREN